MKLGDENRRVWRYDAMKNKVYPVEQLMARGFDEPRMLCTLDLDPYESAVFFTATGEEMDGIAEKADPNERREAWRTDISKDWEVEIAESSDEPVFRPLDSGQVKSEDGSLLPVSDALPAFSGFMRYSRVIRIADPKKRYEIETQHLYEVGRLFVNGKETDFRLCPPYRFDLGNELKEGDNLITIEAANTPLRDVLNYDQGMFGYEKGVYEPSGIFGRISLIELS